MTSQAQAMAPLARRWIGVPGIFRCIRQASRPAIGQAPVRCFKSRCLFLQGTRDNLAELTVLEPVVKRLGRSACCILSRRRSFLPCAGAFGRNDSDVMNEVLDTLADWIGAIETRRAVSMTRD